MGRAVLTVRRNSEISPGATMPSSLGDFRPDAGINVVLAGVALDNAVSGAAALDRAASEAAASLRRRLSSDSPFLFARILQPPLRIQRGHAACSRAGDRLTINVILHIAGCEDPRL